MYTGYYLAMDTIGHPAMRKLWLLLACFTLFVLFEARAQNYNSNAAGSWTGSIWTNISGWGPATPPLSGQGSGTINVNHDISINSNYSSGSATLNVNGGHTLTINGNLSVTGGSTINVYGTLVVTGSATLSSNLRIHPGGRVIIEQSITVNSSNYLTVGTNVAAPPYADLIVYGNLVSNSSGDVTVNRNGRVAVFGNVTATGGGTVLTVNNGGQVYVHGNVNFSGGGSSIVNNNTTNPYGLYVNGTITNSGGGSSTTGNTGDEVTMENTNPTFYDWVANIDFSPLPVELLYFLVQKNADQQVVVEWATATEINASHFEVQRSSDGMYFVSIGREGAFGNSNVKRLYSFADVSPLIQRTYYRLKQVDFDGNVAYSDIRVIEITGAKAVALAPNPVQDGNLRFRLNFTSENAVHVTITNSSGRRFYEFDLAGNSFEGPLNLNAGVYILQVRTESELLIERFVVQ